MRAGGGGGDLIHGAVKYETRCEALAALVELARKLDDRAGKRGGGAERSAPCRCSSMLALANASVQPVPWLR